MRGLAARLPPLTLLLALACQPQPSKPILFGPWEEGLTLGYEDPTLPASQRMEQRLQIRVAQSRLAPDEPGLVRLTLTSLRGQNAVLVRHAKGGITQLSEDGKPLAQTLPEGFPTTTDWIDGGVSYHLVGRAAWDGAALLPPGADPIGFWVEAAPPSGPRLRTLYLPDLGEVESREWREGAWVPVKRLVARGFTEAPAFKPVR